MIIEITVFPGRTEEMKAALYKNICDNLSSLGLTPDDIFIQLTEQPLCNWGIGGQIKTMKEERTASILGEVPDLLLAYLQVIIPQLLFPMLEAE